MHLEGCLEPCFTHIPPPLGARSTGSSLKLSSGLTHVPAFPSSLLEGTNCSPSLPQLTSGPCGLELSHPWRGEGILKRAGEAPNSKEQNPGELLSLRSFRCADCPPESTASMGRERTRAVPADVLFEVFCGVFPNVFILHFSLRFWG